MKNCGAGFMLMKKWIKESWEKYKEGWSNWWHFKFLALLKLYKRLFDVGAEQWLEEWNGKKIVANVKMDEVMAMGNNQKEVKEKMTEGYCVKCKKSVTMKDEKVAPNARGVNMAKGKCHACGTTVCRILGKK